MFVLPTEARALLQDGRSIRGPGGLVLRGVPDGRIAYDGGGTAESGDVLWTMLRFSGSILIIFCVVSLETQIHVDLRPI